jgi:hypothetical protein
LPLLVKPVSRPSGSGVNDTSRCSGGPAIGTRCQAVCLTPSSSVSTALPSGVRAAWSMSYSPMPTIVGPLHVVPPSPEASAKVTLRACSSSPGTTMMSAPSCLRSSRCGLPTTIDGKPRSSVGVQPVRPAGMRQ